MNLNKMNKEQLELMAHLWEIPSDGMTKGQLVELLKKVDKSRAAITQNSVGVPASQLRVGDIFTANSPKWDTWYFINEVKPSDEQGQIKVDIYAWDTTDAYRGNEYDEFYFGTRYPNHVIDITMMVDIQRVEMPEEEQVTHWHFRVGEFAGKNPGYEEGWISIKDRDETWHGWPCYMRSNDMGEFRAYFSPVIAQHLVRTQAQTWEEGRDILTWSSPEKKEIKFYQSDGKEKAVNVNDEGLFLANPGWGWEQVPDGWPEPPPEGGGGGDGDDKCETCGGSGKKPEDNDEKKDGQGDGDGEKDDNKDNGGKGSGKGDQEDDAQQDDGDGQGQGDGDGDKDDKCPDCGGSGKKPNKNEGDGDGQGDGNNEKDGRRKSNLGKGDGNRGKGHDGRAFDGNFDEKEGGDGRSDTPEGDDSDFAPPPEIEEIEVEHKPCPKCGSQPTVVGHMTNFCGKCEELYHNTGWNEH